VEQFQPGSTPPSAPEDPPIRQAIRRRRPGTRAAAVSIAALALIATFASVGNAAAESWMDRDSRVDLRLAKDQPTTSTDAQDFTATLSTPLSFVSNVSSPSGDSIVSSKGDYHVAPELSLKWAHQYSWFKTSVAVGIGIDRYASVSGGNLDTFYTSFKAAMTDGRSDLFIPYAVYTATIYAEPLFKHQDIAYHEAGAGFSSGIGLRGTQSIKYADADKPGDISVNLDVRAGRKLADITDYNNTFVAAKVDIDYVISETLTGEVTPKFRVRRYDDYFGEPRRDYRAGVGIRAIWKPEWLKKLVKRSEISFNFDVYRNYSNLPDKNYSVWELGPTVELSAKF
jgi:hypothetical protein